MRAKKVETVTSDEENIRLNIYDGVIPLGEAGGELLRLALAEHNRTQTLGRDLQRLREDMLTLIATLNTPWPVRWWRWWRSNR